MDELDMILSSEGNEKKQLTTAAINEYLKGFNLHELNEILEHCRAIHKRDDLNEEDFEFPY